ncbi:H0502G05.11 protein, putative [Theobroma cacao]|uniref:H0502G05.11 protein, putative n=1 Tax=Theobroma cacao TaxID=3641 RepID=A0A061GXH8_THECC|nr:H0502G05.11 protein, putative [Theobroma cacao]
MLETISQLASSTPTFFQAQSVHLNADENASNGSIPLVVNTNVNGGNGENATDVVGFVIMEKLQKLLDQKNKRFSFFKFDLKFPYLANIAVESYPKDCTSPKFKQFNGCLEKSSYSLLKKRLILLIWEENIKSSEKMSWNISNALEKWCWIYKSLMVRRSW